jgi:ATP-dependent Clp protease adaptor protein ClpS
VAPQGATATREAPARPRLDKLPPWRVLLHNDDVNDMVYVIASLMEITHLEKQRAMLATLEAHTEGVALLTVAHQELAELYKDQLTSKGLSVTIEPAE